MKSKQLFLFFGAFFVLELASFLTIDNHNVSSVIATILTILVAVLAWKNLAYGVYAILIELILGGKGYLFSLSIGNAIISFRMLIFIVVIGIWLAKFLFQKEKIKYLHQLFGALWWPYFAFLAMILVGIVNGLLGQHDFGAVFLDANAFGYLLLAPVFLEGLKLEENKKQAVRIWLAAAFWLAVKTIILFALFSWFGRDYLDYLYRWVRNSGVGEITWLFGVRVFLYSQIFIVAAWLYILFSNFGERLKKVTPILILFGTAILISLSRSFFVGIITAVISIGIYLIWQKKFSDLKIIFVRLIISLLGAYTLVLLLIGSLFSPQDRLTNDAGESSRRNQLPVLLEAIKQNPFGYGFGKTLTYKTTDPRALTINPTGQYTTYSFELAWLDFFLKTGLFGLAAYLWFLWAILRQIWPKFELFAPILALIATHGFTPYLNHPLGIGLLFLIATQVDLEQKKS